jgi:hypothetical protein
MGHAKESPFTLPYEPQYSRHRDDQTERRRSRLMSRLHENRLYEPFSAIIRSERRAKIRRTPGRVPR